MDHGAPADRGVRQLSRRTPRSAGAVGRWIMCRVRHDSTFVFRLDSFHEIGDAVAARLLGRGAGRRRRRADSSNQKPTTLFPAVFLQKRVGPPRCSGFYQKCPVPLCKIFSKIFFQTRFTRHQSTPDGGDSAVRPSLVVSRGPAMSS